MKRTILLLLAVGFVNVTFAQDLSDCKKTCEVEKVVESGALLGVRIVPLCTSQFAQVVELLPNTAAERNNVELNDIITTIDGIRVLNNLHLAEIINTHQPHDIIAVTLIRNGNTITKKIELGAKETKIVTERICCDEVIVVKQVATNNLISSKVNFVLFPNPANNTLQITSDEIVTGKVEINIFDMLGNQVISKKIGDNPDVLNQKLSLVDLSSGNYIVKITNNDLISVAKLIVSK